MARIYAGRSSRWHTDYDRGRPGWPPDAIAVPGLSSSASVAELGAGTGKLTRLLVTAFAHVVAIEPDQGMRSLLARRVPRAEIRDGTAAEIPLPGSCVDAVFAAEAFHLFASKQAVRQIARVLRPGGALVLMWNLPAGPTTPSIVAVERLLAERGPDRQQAGYDPVDLSPERYESGQWRLAFARSRFGEFAQTRLPHVQTIDQGGLVAFFASMGWVAELPDAERLPLLTQVRTLLAAAEYRRPWQAHVHCARL